MRSRGIRFAAAVPEDFGYIIDRARNQAQDALARLVPSARHIVVTGSGHNIQIDHPGAVAHTLHEVVGAARQPQASPCASPS